MEKYQEYYPHGIMFHRFHKHDQIGGSITANNLEDIINIIGIDRIISPSKWIQKCINDNLDNRDVCLTFDDCLKSQFNFALPILKKYNLKAFFFVHSITFENNYEYNELFYNLIYKKYTSFNIFFNDYLKKMKIDIDIFTTTQYLNFKDDLLSKFNNYTEKEVMYRYLRNIFYKNDEFNESLKKFFAPEIRQINKIESIWMDINDIKSLSKSGHYIGLHTHSHHINFLSLNFDQQKNEYETNKKNLESIINEKIQASSHPLGLYNSDTIKILKSLDIICSFRSNTLIPNGHKKINPSFYEIARNDVANINYC